MEQNQPVENDDLQKAIDNITNNTNADPVFSDPVAAPSSVPEGDTGELDEPVGPFPEPKVDVVAPAPEPIAPLESAAIPDLNTLAAPTPEAPTSAPAPAPIAAPAPAPETPVLAPAPAPEVPTLNPEAPVSDNLNMHQVKEAALRDLVPLVSHLEMNPSQKFNLYRNIFEQLKDYTVLESAYRAATEITNDTERAEALLYLVESIDKM